MIFFIIRHNFPENGDNNDILKRMHTSILAAVKQQLFITQGLTNCSLNENNRNRTNIVMDRGAIHLWLSK